MTKEIFQLTSDPKYSWVELVNENDGELLELTLENSLPMPWHEIEMTVMKKDNPHKPPYKQLSDSPAANVFSSLIVSERARNIIARFEGALNFLPIRIDKKPFFILQAIKPLKVLEAGSEIDYFDQEGTRIRHIRKYVFDQKTISSLNIFAIQGFHGHFFVSDVLKSELSNHCKGFAFHDTSVYRDSFMTFANS